MEGILRIQSNEWCDSPRYAIQLQENKNQKTNRPGPEKLQLFISSPYFIFPF